MLEKVGMADVSILETFAHATKRKTYTSESPATEEKAPASPLLEQHQFTEREKPYSHATYYLTEEPPVILPSAPNDQEKYSYVETNRMGVIPSQIISVLSRLATTLTVDRFAKIFISFAVWNTILGLSTTILNTLSYKFDIARHRKLLKTYSITTKSAPTVDIYLPVCREPLEIIENTWRHVARLQYPKDKLKIHVLDDGAMDEVLELSRKYGFNYIVRDDRPRMKKAGNMRWTYARTTGQMFTGASNFHSKWFLRIFFHRTSNLETYFEAFCPRY